jgi:hypothetical protein
VDDEIMQAVIESSKAEFQAVGGKGVVVDEEEEVKKAMQMSIADSGEYPESSNSALVPILKNDLSSSTCGCRCGKQMNSANWRRPSSRARQTSDSWVSKQHHTISDIYEAASIPVLGIP